MRGAAGAIVRVEIDEDVKCQVIGNAPPLGICGSGLIDAVAQMLNSGVLEKDGRLARKTFDALPAKLKERFLQKGKIRIRLLPDLPRDRISYIGNAALIGAEMTLLSEHERNEAETIAERIEHVALATHSDFQYIFVDASRFEGD
ncbi:MAG: DUF4445 domain-containing protein [Rhizobiaceae bacterium]|nr:DUF4445 domain-containing protein [Rhizobiaceae bacterium]